MGVARVVLVLSLILALAAGSVAAAPARSVAAGRTGETVLGTSVVLVAY